MGDDMNRIKQARTLTGLTQAQLAAKLGVGRTTVTMWENNSAEPDNTMLLNIAAILNVSVDYLLGADCAVSSETAEPIRIPVVGSVPAGIPISAIEDIVDWEDIPQDMTAGGKEYFGLKVKGDSMYPEYLDGDTVIVRKSPVCDSGDVCVVYVNGYEATLKQVKLDPEDGSLTLIPRNPNYSPRTYTAAEIAELPVSICGVVVELRRKVKKM